MITWNYFPFHYLSQAKFDSQLSNHNVPGKASSRQFNYFLSLAGAHLPTLAPIAENLLIEEKKSKIKVSCVQTFDTADLST